MKEVHMLKALKAYCPNALPMHMPGHKRNTLMASYLKELGAEWDITEIDGFDDLHAPEGMIADSEARAARLFGSEHSIYLVGGSTAGILSAVYALGQGKQTCVIARNAHKSVYHALEITGLQATFVYPQVDCETGMNASISPDAAEKALQNTPGAAFVLITSPTYEGVISDVRSIADVAHKYGAKLIVDEAHGAHLGLGNAFGNGAVKAGADIVVQSLHKTLPCLTQTAIMHAAKGVDYKKLMHAIDIFETSSPSYLLMASIDGCVKLLSEKGKEILGHWRESLEGFRKETSALKKIRILTPDSANVFAFDQSKIIIGIGNSALSGVDIMRLLRNRFHIELEAAYERYAIAMTGAGDTEHSLMRLAEALIAIDRDAPSGESRPVFPGMEALEAVTSVKDALACVCESVKPEEAVGRVSAEYAWAYPPGIPLMVPGERITDNVVRAFLSMKHMGIKMLTTSGADGAFAVIPENSISGCQAHRKIT